LPSKNIDQHVREQLSRLQEGCVLLANENLQDPNFSSTVVLICAHTKDGAYGLIVNRPSHMPLCEVFSTDAFDGSELRKIYIGGPVRQEVMQLLQITDSPKSNSYQIARNVHLGGDWTSLDEILAADDSSIMLFLGYSGWAPDQLEDEIKQGAWDVYSVKLKELLNSQEPRLYGDLDDIREYLESIRRT
jgi:putative transcriptional regulator